TVFGRVTPEQKKGMVIALQSRGHTVAMTGDGVNDAPALKKADIGIAMGKVGTDVSREAADMVLADDNFATIVKAVEQGRVVFDNLRKFILFLLSCNVSEVLIIFFATLIAAFGFAGSTEGPPLFALQILWINLVTDGLPALALGVDPGDPHVMERKPRSADEAILNRKTITSFVSQGFFITVAALAMFYAVELGWFGPAADANEARTMLFTTLVLAQLLHAFSFRSLDRTVFSLESLKNKYLNMAVVGSLLLQMAVVYLPFAQKIFHTYRLTLVDWAWVLLASFVPLVINDIIKVARAKRAA
ncbi:MAG TPA: HAD-IC family P-type ATPase, partial [Brevibacterium sp.]|nr:HAD-IC family P-type ATPase [Brevibacterium sp.]